MAKEKLKVFKCKYNSGGYCVHRENHVKGRRRMKCVIKGCNNNRMSRGDGRFHIRCTKHHKMKYKMTYGNKKKMLWEVLGISKEPCVRCGWNESYCDRHRIISGNNGGEYTKKNVIALCPNCHRIEHRGKINSIT